jgi:hypothetical protein
MLNPLNSSNRKHGPTTKARSWPKRYLKAAGYVAGAFVLLFVAWKAVFMIRVTAGITAAAEPTERLMRLEVVDAGGYGRSAAQFADDLSKLSDQDLDIKIIRVSAFDLHRVQKSFVVSRQRDNKAAKELARRIGLRSADIVYRSGVEDRLAATATLVLGKDYESLIKQDRSEEES